MDYPLSLHKLSKGHLIFFPISPPYFVLFALFRPKFSIYVLVSSSSHTIPYTENSTLKLWLKLYFRYGLKTGEQNIVNNSNKNVVMHPMKRKTKTKSLMLMTKQNRKRFVDTR